MQNEKRPDKRKEGRNVGKIGNFRTAPRFECHCPCNRGDRHNENAVPRKAKHLRQFHVPPSTQSQIDNQAQGEGGKKGELSVEVFLSVCAEVLRKQNISPVCDAFFVGHESSAKKKSIRICELERYFTKKHTHTIDCEDMGEVLDCFFDIKGTSSNINASGELTADISGLITFVIKKDDDIEKSEKAIPISLSVAADESLCGADCFCEVTGFNCRKHSGKNAAELTLFINCKAEKFCEEEILEELVVNDERLMGDKKTAVCIYFAEAGEDIFDIAKSHNSSALAILKENGLEDFEIKKRQPILIPMA